MDDTRPQVRYWIPEGYVTEEGLRADVRSLARRGFGAIELVAVNFFGQSIPDDCRWGTPRYYEAVHTVLDEASALSLAVDVANGPGWPISVPLITCADDPAALYELTYGVTEVAAGAHSRLLLPERRVVHDEGTPQLVAACAYRLVGERLLDEKNYVDLTPQVHGDAIDWAPEAGTGTWAVFGFWGQPACHKVLDRFFVVDHLSRTGAEASVAWWECELLPALGDQAPYLRSFFCDSLEYRVAMEWTRDFAEAFETRYGYSVLPYLPVVGEPGTYPKNDVAGYAFTDAELTRAVRHDYLEICSWMYAERHLRTLCDGATKLGKTVRYQVAYNKPFCEEDAAAAVDIPETESLGRPTLDNLRVMAGPTHLARRPRLSFEAAAEFGSGYGQTQEDLLWWLKRAAMAGCGAQVLHGASYCGDGMEGISWPGWEAWNRLCSNNWNRTLSERSFAEMTAAISRLNALRCERALVDLAFFRQAYLNDGHGADGAHYVWDDGLLGARGYSYEFLSEGLLAHANAVVRDGRLDPDGAAYRALVVAGGQPVTRAGLVRMAELVHAGLPVFFVGEGALVPAGMAGLRDRPAWQEAYDALMAAGVVQVADYAQLLAALAAQGVLPAASFDAPSVVSAHVRTADGDAYLLYNGNRTGVDAATGKPDPATFMPAVLRSTAFAPVELDVELEGEGDPCWLDLATGAWYALPFARTERGARLVLALEADELAVVGLRADAAGLPPRSGCGFDACELPEPDVCAWELLPADGPCDLLGGGFCEVAEAGPGFAGYLAYRYAFDLDRLPREAWLELPVWNDALELELNGQAIPVVAGLGRRVDVRPALRSGTNDLVIRVFTNLSNRLDKDASQRYGLFGRPVLLAK